MKKRYDELLMGLFIKDYQPFSIVEDEGFKNFVAALAPDYSLPGRKYLSDSLLHEMYNKCYESTREQMNQVKKICLTTDHWTSTANYMGITAHFIDEDFKLRSKLIKCIKFEGEHTAVQIAAEMKRTAEEWSLLDKILIVITDNASNITNAVTKELMWKHFGCFAHKLNLVVRSALKSETLIIEKVKTIVNHFKRSPQATEKLLKAQRQLGNDNPLCVIQDVETRWNSTYHMIQRLVKIQEAIRSTVANLNAPKINMLSETEWKICEEICILLKPFEEATLEVSGENYLTGSVIIGIARGLNSVTKKAINLNYCENSTNFADQLVAGLEQRFPDLEKSRTIGVCTFLDPRFKLYIFENQEHAQDIKKQVINLVTAIINVKTAEASTGRQQPRLEAKKETDNSTEKNVLSYWAEFDNKMADLIPKGTATSQAILEVDRYCNDTIISRKDDPLLWWKNNQQLYPNLADLARKQLCMVATSVPCERLFSRSSLIISDRRTRLSATKVNKLLFLNANT
ncbi:unnamed protein product [Acanthoscelides obtectus]|uniref:HAT C-terminal dimerisation domain-containing protein n=1 Tax=Acanthoscelides obtectus TaxID=200917 RepID=A0A9P0KS90_ACAOB|nr:unnamed protein product [Acanthoscelides obtectus]CAK1641704.1 hypothetical protein AOBTE_LOCUS12566 [Acanthoscelides obtectus]